MTKKEIYAAHGIEFAHDRISWRGQWIPELLKAGNSKTGTAVYTWSMPAGICTGLYGPVWIRAYYPK